MKQESLGPNPYEDPITPNQDPNNPNQAAAWSDTGLFKNEEPIPLYVAIIVTILK